MSERTAAGRRRVCVIISARPTYARIKTALLALRDHPGLELQIVVMGSMLLDRFGTPANVVEQDGLAISGRVHMLVEGETPLTSVKSTALALMDLATLFDNLRLDVVVTIGDRYETIATAVAASYLNIPLAHVQGGEVTGTIDEKVRHSVTKLANLHFTATQLARERVIRMGERPEAVFCTGCPSIDLAATVAQEPTLDIKELRPGYTGVGAPIDLARDYLVVIQHPVATEFASARAQVAETLAAVRTLGIPTVWFWPNADPGSEDTSKGIRAFRELQGDRNIHFVKNLRPESFLRVLYHSRCIVGNSSTAMRECAFLGVPAVNVGTREDGRERGMNVVDVGYEQREIIEAIKKQVSNGRYPCDRLYGDGKAGERIAHLLATVPLTIEKRLAY